MRAGGRCRCRRSRLKRSSSSQRVGRAHSCSPPSGAATSTCTTSATVSGSRRRSPPGSTPAQGLRSPAYLCDLRAPCRHLDLRPLPLHGRQPDRDRPPLRPPRPRRTRTCDPPARRAERGRTSTVDAGGRRVDTGFRGRQSATTTETAAKQAESRSPLPDSNRRPPPYHSGLKPGSAHDRVAAATKAPQTEGI
jgi:hypothetical protein